MTFKFIHPTAAQVLKFASFALVIINTLLAFGATIHTVPGIPVNVAIYWPVVYGVAFGLHQMASNFGIVPDAKFQEQVSEVVQKASIAASAIRLPVMPFSDLTPESASIGGMTAGILDHVAFEAGVNIAKHGGQLIDGASDSAKAGFNSVHPRERGQYDADGKLRPAQSTAAH